MKISDNLRSRWTTFAGFANSTAKRPATRNIIGYREWKPPLARSDKVSQPASALPSPKNGSPTDTTNRALKSSTTTFTEDVAARFLAYGWNVLRVGDANDIGRIEEAFKIFQQTKGRPTFIVLDSHIGYGL